VLTSLHPDIKAIRTIRYETETHTKLEFLKPRQIISGLQKDRVYNPHL
jgi:hypothetical protein